MSNNNNRDNGFKRIKIRDNDIEQIEPGRDEKGKFTTGNTFGGDRTSHRKELIEAIKRQEAKQGKIL